MSVATAGVGVMALAAVLLAVAPAAATLVGGAGVLIVRTALVDLSRTGAVKLELNRNPNETNNVSGCGPFGVTLVSTLHTAHAARATRRDHADDRVLVEDGSVGLADGVWCCLILPAGPPSLLS